MEPNSNLSPNHYTQILSNSDEIFNILTNQFPDSNPNREFTDLRRELYHRFSIGLSFPENYVPKEKILVQALKKMVDKASALLKQNEQLSKIEDKQKEEIRTLEQALKDQANKLASVERAAQQQAKELKKTIEKVTNESRMWQTRIEEGERMFLNKIRELQDQFHLKQKELRNARFVQQEKLAAPGRASISVPAELQINQLKKQVSAFDELTHLLLNFFEQTRTVLYKGAARRKEFVDKHFKSNEPTQRPREIIDHLFAGLARHAKSISLNIGDLQLAVQDAESFVTFLDHFDGLLSPEFHSFQEAQQKPNNTKQPNLNDLFFARKFSTVMDVNKMQQLLEDFTEMIESQKPAFKGLGIEPASPEDLIDPWRTPGKRESEQTLFTPRPRATREHKEALAKVTKELEVSIGSFNHVNGKLQQELRQLTQVTNELNHS